MEKINYQHGKLLSFQEYFKHKGGHWIDIETKKVTKIRHFDYDTCWHHINPDPDRRRCGHFRMLFEAKNFIPSFCLNCWKVCVTPRTLRELYLLRDIMFELVKDNPRCFCKCGTEHRDWTPGKIYGGYFYTNSKDVGMERWKTVRQKVTDKIDKNVIVILKRYCTEFEIITGPSDKYIRPSNADEVEKEFMSIVDMSFDQIFQPSFILRETELKWIRHGWRWGIPEDRREIELDHNNGQPLYLSPKTYNPE